MIEYLYDCIRATAGDTVFITAEITGEDGEPLTEGCHMMLYEEGADESFCHAEGKYIGDRWIFEIPAEVTRKLNGRYKYCVCDINNTDLCFKQPIYFLQ